MDDEELARRRRAFGRAVDAYDRTRPTYPAEAVAWCLGDPIGTLDVADVGAGTGKLTAVVLAAGHRVVAVEPDEVMRARLAARLDAGPDASGVLDTRAGAAEDLPLADASVDAVVAGQAWHWFDEEAVGDELARVVRPGGTAAAIWNSRDEEVDWVRAWSELVEEGAHPTGRKLVSARGPDFGAGFGPPEVATFHHEQVLAPEEVVTLAASRSHTIWLPADRRTALLDAVADLVASHPDLAGRERISLPYRVDCHRATRRT